jgi:hypothetical protein
MKKFLVILFAVAILVTSCAFAEEPEAEAVPLYYPCMVTGNKVRERVAPNTDCEVVCLHKKGDIVNVVDPNPEAEWWELDNGHFMAAKYLELMCSNDSPYATDVEFLVTDESEEGVTAEEVAACFRLLQYGVASPGATKEDIVALTHDCVLLITRERCIECYQNDELILRIDLVLSMPYAKFAVSAPNEVTYEVQYIRDVAALVRDYSTDYTHFVVID